MRTGNPIMIDSIYLDNIMIEHPLFGQLLVSDIQTIGNYVVGTFLQGFGTVVIQTGLIQTDTHKGGQEWS